jgi:hypothetical protein
MHDGLTARLVADRRARLVDELSSSRRAQRRRRARLHQLLEGWSARLRLASVRSVAGSRPADTPTVQPIAPV